MEIEDTNLPEVKILKPFVYSDERGSFYESYNKSVFEKLTGKKIDFVQDAHSISMQNILRGMHYQVNKPQGKIVRVVHGEIYDVVLDIRQSSTTYGKWFGINLSAANKKQLWIPEGFAHGFFVLSDVAEVLYKMTDYYAPEYNRCIKWDDPDINISWPLSKEPPILNEKDQNGQRFTEAEVFK